MPNESAPLLIVDGDNMTHRAYHSTPKTIKGADDFPINAIVGFFNRLIMIWKQERPRAVVVCWDTLGEPTYRNELLPEYQSGRVFDPEIVQQLEVLPGLCHAFGFGIAKKAGYEADDLIASTVGAELLQDGTCLVLTSDKDTFQLVSEKVTVLSPKKGASELDRIGPAEVVERLGVLPNQVADFKALSGDPSDKIPGIRGIGPKTAAKLLKTYGSLAEVLNTWNDPELTTLAFKFKNIVTMHVSFSVELPPSGDPDWQSGSAALLAIGAKTLGQRLSQEPKN